MLTQDEDNLDKDTDCATSKTIVCSRSHTLTIAVEVVTCADARLATVTSWQETSSRNDALNRCLERRHAGDQPVTVGRRLRVSVPAPPRRHRRRLVGGTAPCRPAVGTPTGSWCSSRSRRTDCSSSCSSRANATRSRQSVCAGTTRRQG